ncbi:alpha/beta hydrolase [Phyllobacterium sp. YR531]|uniref:alpha/beta fold hydrolase n=1 Tax=Phyllobacterium sp. YR531 TaxID=1144343 RepID=UPI00026FA0F1|nr:alpha/beta hydrolase [Phyllobacterium sp. YR531]EJN05940.1 putative hydrolase or acyltransferase of alpha/beta superfamily [Phyllobacterium sp. YR531]
MKNHLMSAGISFGLLASPVQLSAAQIAVPTQSEWSAAKKSVSLPNGITIAYSEMGDTNGKPLLLIHGYTDNSRSWSLLTPYLVGHHIYAIDLRGHGKSSAPECCYAYTDLANDVYLFLNAMKIEKADVVGHSLGSITTQVLSAQHPNTVDNIVLISSTVNTGGGPGTWLWDNIMPLTPPIDQNGKFMMDWYWNPNPVDGTFIKLEREESAKVPMHVWKGVLWGTSLGDLSKVSQLIKAPIMILWGDQDQLFDASHQKTLKVAYPTARYEIFEGAGHNMFWEQPEKAAKLINDFLR